MADPANPVLLYDGVCGLCNRLVQFVLKRDNQAVTSVSPLCKVTTPPESCSITALILMIMDTLYVVEESGQRLPPAPMP